MVHYIVDNAEGVLDSLNGIFYGEIKPLVIPQRISIVGYEEVVLIGPSSSEGAV